MRTQVGIVGAGPAGLLLSHLLHLHGISSAVLEPRSREHIEHRVRAGVLEQGTVDVLREAGLADRLDRQGLRHEGIELRFDGEGHRVPMADLTGRAITVYGQQEVVKDLVARRLADGGDIRFEVTDIWLAGLTAGQPVIHFVHEGGPVELSCDVIAGCDGFHGISRPSVPAGELTVFEREYPFGWLGILAEAPPAVDELIYCLHETGFALYSMRSPQISRLYLQVPVDEDIASWPDERIWAELAIRFTLAGSDWRPTEGPLPENRLMARALDAWYSSGDETLLASYSRDALRCVWRAQHFSWWMTSMLHRFPGDDPYQHRLQIAQLRNVVDSTAYATALAENYVG